MEEDRDAGMASDLAAYEAMPLPLCVLQLQNGVWRLLAESEGYIRLLNRPRSGAAGDPFDDICADDREMAKSAWEYAALYPDEACKSAYRLRVQPGISLRVSCSGVSDRSGRLFLTYLPLAGEQSAPPVWRTEARADSLRAQDAGNRLLAKWHSDLTANRTLSYAAYSARALQVPEDGAYGEACAILSGAPFFREEREKLAQMLDRERLLRCFKEGERSFNLEYRRDENGQMPFWVHVSVSTFQSRDSGHVECYICAYDITEKVLEEQILSRLTMLGYDVVGLLYVKTGKCRFFRIKKLRYGMDCEQYEDYQESIECDIDRIIVPDQRDAVRKGLRLEVIREALKTAPIYPFSYSMIRKDGQHLQKLLQFSYLDERQDTIFLCKSDITKQYESEHLQIERLREAKLEADRANAAKSSFLSSMSHDLRTPINGILGFTGLALHERDPEKKQDYMEKVLSSSELLLDLVNDTLELSQIESGKFVLAPEPVRICDMADAVLTSLGPSAEIKNLHIVKQPPAFPEQTVLADKLKFQKVFLNLLSNAIKYTPSGGTIVASVEMLEPAHEGRNCRMTVRDNGIGIYPDFLPQIFDAFTQEHRPESKTVLGTGLGLAIVKRIVTCMGGTVDVSSTPGVGSEFCVELPLLPAEKAEAVLLPQENNAILAGHRVLLCEDNSLNAEIARILLEEQGVQIVWEENGKLGAERFRASAPGEFSAILMDIRMPVMDGVEAARFIRAMARPDAASIPIIAMTADAFEQDIQSCREAGMNAHVIKPIDPKKLFAALREAFSGNTE